MATPFLNGYSVKPATVGGTGIVTFTDGRIEVTPNQQQCEAYGYTYNKDTGTCRAFTYSTTLQNSLISEGNIIKGQDNIVMMGTGNTHIVGESNTVKGLSRNSIITGNQNEIANGVNNASVSGTLGEATADNSKVLGGNASTDALGERQSIHLMYGIQTLNETNTVSFLNNTTDSLFAIPDNTVMYFQADIVAVRVGGVHIHGANGDFASWVEKGVIINKSGVVSIERVRDTIKSSGTVTGWVPTAIVSGTNFAMRVKGHADMTVEWCSNITFTQIKTGVTL